MSVALSPVKTYTPLEIWPSGAEFEYKTALDSLPLEFRKARARGRKAQVRHKIMAIVLLPFFRCGRSYSGNPDCDA